MTTQTPEEVRREAEEDAAWLLSPKNLANSKYSERARRVARALTTALSRVEELSEQLNWDGRNRYAIGGTATAPDDGRMLAISIWDRTAKESLRFVPEQTLTTALATIETLRDALGFTEPKKRDGALVSNDAWLNLSSAIEDIKIAKQTGSAMQVDGVTMRTLCRVEEQLAKAKSALSSLPAAAREPSNG